MLGLYSNCFNGFVLSHPAPPPHTKTNPQKSNTTTISYTITMWLEGSIAFTLVIYVFESYLDYRQYQNLLCRETTRRAFERDQEDALKKKITDKFQDSQAYGRAKAKFGAFRRFIDEILENALLLAFFGPWVWRKAEFIAEEYFSSDDVHSHVSSVGWNTTLPLSTVKYSISNTTVNLWSRRDSDSTK